MLPFYNYLLLLLYGQDFNLTETAPDYKRLIGVNEKKGEEEKFIIQAYPQKGARKAIGNYRNMFTPGLLSWSVWPSLLE